MWSIQATLHKFIAYRSFGNALTTEQQINLSNNLSRLNDFLQSDVGKVVVGKFGEEFLSFCK